MRTIYSNETKNEIEEINSLISLNFTDCAILKLYKLVIYDLMYKISEYQLEDSKFKNNIVYKKFQKINTIESEGHHFGKSEKELIEALYAQKVINETFKFKFDNLKKSRDYCAHSYVSNGKFYKPSIFEPKDLLDFFTNNLFIHNKYFILKLGNDIEEDIEITKDVIDSRFNIIESCDLQKYEVYKVHLCENIYQNVSIHILARRLKEFMKKILYSDEIHTYFPYTCHAEAILEVLFQRNSKNYIPYSIFRDGKSTLNNSNIVIKFLFHTLQKNLMDLNNIKENNEQYYNVLAKEIKKIVNFQYLAKLSEEFFSTNVVKVLIDEYGYLDNNTIREIEKYIKLDDYNFDYEKNIIEYSKVVDDYYTHDALFELLLQESNKYSRDIVIEVLMNTYSPQNYGRRNFITNMTDIQDKYELKESDFSEEYTIYKNFFKKNDH